MFSNKAGNQSKKKNGLQVQTRLKIGQPGDKYEQEADQVADHVMRSTSESIQMQPMEEEEELQMKPDLQLNSDQAVEASSKMSNNIESTKGGGSPLPHNVQQEMSSKIGTDFSGVNIHTDSKSAQMNRELSARAFTQGSDIYFNSGEYNPSSSRGKHLLAHELTHVVQQNTRGTEPGLVQKNDLGMTTNQRRTDTPYEWDSSYGLEITDDEIRITVHAQINPDSGITEAQQNQVQERTRTEFIRYFDGRFNFEDDSGNIRTVRVDIEYVDSGGEVTINLHSGSGHDNRRNWYVDSEAITRAHELGHQIGLLDEYVDTSTTSRATATSPGVHSDNSIMGNYFNEGIRNADVRARHGTQLADDISAASGMNFTSSWSDTYTVRRRDNLSWIAQRIYGDESRAVEIFELNRNIIEDPNLIYPGQELKLPPR